VEQFFKYELNQTTPLYCSNVAFEISCLNNENINWYNQPL
jgi:hypothetical protein